MATSGPGGQMLLPRHTLSTSSGSPVSLLFVQNRWVSGEENGKSGALGLWARLGGTRLS